MLSTADLISFNYSCTTTSYIPYSSLNPDRHKSARFLGHFCLCFFPSNSRHFSLDPILAGILRAFSSLFAGYFARCPFSVMEHFPRFRRKKDIAPPPLITPNNIDTMRQTTPPPSDLHPVVPPIAPIRTVQKLSPFNLFHRSSGKRARDSPPASLPHSPAAAAVFSPDSIAGRPVSPLSLKTDATGGRDDHAARPPKIPAFLELSPQGE